MPDQLKDRIAALLAPTLPASVLVRRLQPGASPQARRKLRRRVTALLSMLADRGVVANTGAGWRAELKGEFHA